MALKPFRSYNEHDVVNLFGYHAGDSLPAGTVVKVSEGVKLDNNGPVDSMSDALGLQVGNTVSMRYGTRAKIVIANEFDSALGITLMPVAELDENGEKLVFNPRKAAEMGVVVKGQAVPVLTRGVVHITLNGNAIAGQEVKQANNGNLTTDSAAAGKVVGKLLSDVVDGAALVQLQF
jgi:hypothetical protein